MQPALDFVGEDTKSASELKKFLVALPRLNFNDAVRRAFGAAKAPVKEFLASYAERFEFNKTLTQVRLKGITRRRRLRGKQQANGGKGPVRTAATGAVNVRSAASPKTDVRTGRFAANVTRGRRVRAGNR